MNFTWTGRSYFVFNAKETLPQFNFHGLVYRLHFGFGQMDFVVHCIVVFQETGKVWIADLQLVIDIHLARELLGGSCALLST